jgi:hypothetical protein
LLVKYGVLHKSLQLVQAAYPWLRVTHVDDAVLTYLEARLEARIRDHLFAHPSVGKTFTIGVPRTREGSEKV